MSPRRGGVVGVADKDPLSLDPLPPLPLPPPPTAKSKLPFHLIFFELASKALEEEEAALPVFDVDEVFRSLRTVA